MSIARLRAILQSTYRINLVSTPALARRLNRKTANLIQKAVNKKTPAPQIKQASPVQINGTLTWMIRPIDLLHKIGSLTTPADTNLAKLSASWATRRYCWSIAEPDGRSNPFRLSNDARDLDFHQKTLLSDEFGIGFAGLLLEDRFGAGQFVDISKALKDPQAYQAIQQNGRAQPDYLIWSAFPNSPYYVVECKGSQSGRAYCYSQLHRGLEQVPSIAFGAGARSVTSMVVATCLEETSTTVFVIDPPPDETTSGDNEEPNAEEVSVRTGERSWKVPNFERFEDRAWIAQESTLLKWAGQYREAAMRDEELETRQLRREEIPESVEPVRKETEFGVFVGTRNNTFPELGRGQIRLFTGVEEELFASLTERNRRSRDITMRNQLRFNFGQEDTANRSPFSSVSKNGTCMIVEGL